MLCGWGGNCRPGGKQWQPTAGWMTYGHLQADCLYNGISSWPNAPYRVWEAFTFTLAYSRWWSSIPFTFSLTQIQSSKSCTNPSLFISAASCDVLLPGAAQESITLLPLGGFNTTAGKQLACYRNAHILTALLITFLPLWLLSFLLNPA